MRSVAVSASPISPESAGIVSVSAVTQTPEYLREARAYLPPTHQTVRSSSPSVPHSPTNSSPIISSTGLTSGDRGRRREVRFDENIVRSEPVWEESTSSDASLDDPIPYRRPNGVHTKKFGDLFCTFSLSISDLRTQGPADCLGLHPSNGEGSRMENPITCHAHPMSGRSIIHLHHLTIAGSV